MKLHARVYTERGRTPIWRVKDAGIYTAFPHFLRGTYMTAPSRREALGVPLTFTSLFFTMFFATFCFRCGCKDFQTSTEAEQRRAPPLHLSRARAKGASCGFREAAVIKLHGRRQSNSGQHFLPTEDVAPCASCRCDSLVPWKLRVVETGRVKRLSAFIFLCFFILFLPFLFPS